MSIRFVRSASPLAISEMAFSTMLSGLSALKSAITPINIRIITERAPPIIKSALILFTRL